jgi:type IV pilus assembly protein PilY1
MNNIMKPTSFFAFLDDYTMKKSLMTRCFLSAMRIMAPSCALGFAVYVHAQTVSPFPAVPPNVSTSKSTPMIMLNMSRDHQLFFRAYNEFTDIDGDGIIDNTYKHSVDYGGYFDPQKCYIYNTTTTVFEPSRVTSTKYCGNSNEWSGNFLNWSTMTRMDLVRKVLYGGYRSTDTATSTILERAHLATEAHDFAKYFKATSTEMRNLTPFSNTEITMCNAGRPSSTTTAPNNWSQTQTNPPLMRVASGNYSLWASNELWQCTWSEEENAGNSNEPSVSGFPAADSNPSSSSNGLGNKNYTVRIKACVSGLVGTENCEAYGSSLKPIGLLHEYGETDQAEFGLITGSFANNIRGGVLRRNITSFKSEINAADGTFSSVKGIVYNLNRLRLYGYRAKDSLYYDSTANGGTNFCDYQTIGLTNGHCQSWGNPMGEMFLEGLRYFGGKGLTSNFDYTDSGSPDASLGLTKEAWIDPFLRSSAAEKLLVEAKYGKGQCRKSNIINFNSSVISYDGDDVSSFSALSSTPIASLVNIIGSAEGINGQSWSVGNNTTTGTDNSCDVKTVTNLSDVRGLCPDGPGYKGSYNLAGLAYWAHVNPVRTDYTNFGTTASAAPKSAFKINSYSVALAPAKPRIEITTSSGKQVSITPSYQLKKSSTEIGSGTLVDFREISRTATTGRYLIIWEDSDQGGDFDSDAIGILTWTLTGDQLDVKTQITGASSSNPQGFGYAITGVETRNGHKPADGIHYHSGMYSYNYTDPRPIEVTRENGTSHPNINSTGGCKNCTPADFLITSSDADPASVAHYNVVTKYNGFPLLEDPLWYAAKWGGFTTNGTSTDTPNTTAKWDQKINATGAAGSDGIPDNYSLVYRPDQLTKALRDALDSIKASANNAPAISTSQLTEGSYKYVATFDDSDQQGKIQAFKLTSSGFLDTPDWKGEEVLTALAPTSRQIITNSTNSAGVKQGIPFAWSSLSLTQQSDLRSGTTDTATVGQERLNWLRGDRSKESSSYKKRTANDILGPIINAAPVLQGTPNASYFGPRFTDSTSQSYYQFRQANLARRKLLWVPSNDGMLHAFDAFDGDGTAGDGALALSYVPGVLFPKLRDLTLLTATGYTSMVDGAPFVADVIAASTPTATDTKWKTYLFEALGRGGKGVFALDVTKTDGVSLIESKANSIFKWEFTSNDDSDMGYITGDAIQHVVSRQPANVAKMANNKFALLLGNGAKSTTGHAVLFILFMEGPDPTTGSWTGNYKKIVLDGTSTDNGLMQVNWADTNGDGSPDAIYAGDLKGNLWKVDVSSTNPSNWGVAYQGLPLYSAKDTDQTTPLPITTAPQPMFHPNGGVMVVFGTGIALQTTDFPNIARTQRIFGIWDSPKYGTTVSSLTTAGPAALPRLFSDLASRTLVRVDADHGYITGSTIDWTQKKGWVLALPLSGEAVLSNPVFLTGPLAIFSVAPSTNAGCDTPPPGYLNVIDPITGTLDADVMGYVQITDSSGNLKNVANASVQILDQRLNFGNDKRSSTLGNSSSSSGGSSLNDGNPLLATGNQENARSLKGVSGKGRVSWREIPTLKTRP